MKVYIKNRYTRGYISYGTPESIYDALYPIQQAFLDIFDRLSDSNLHYLLLSRSKWIRVPDVVFKPVKQ